MPDDERTVAQLAAAFREALGPGRKDGTDKQSAEDSRERREEAVVVATGAALGDREALPGNEADERD